uniref:DUF834 domain-containing protein n=1 Tax=Oryza glaberrima TaxID=4538 RepID=I1NR15_ORYGL
VITLSLPSSSLSLTFLLSAGRPTGGRRSLGRGGRGGGPTAGDAAVGDEVAAATREQAAAPGSDVRGEDGRQLEETGGARRGRWPTDARRHRRDHWTLTLTWKRSPRSPAWTPATTRSRGVLVEAVNDGGAGAVGGGGAPVASFCGGC